MAATRCPLLTRLPLQRLTPTQSRTNKRRCCRPHSLSHLDVEYTSVFDKTSLELFHGNGGSEGVKEIVSVVAEEDEWTKQQVHYRVNRDLTRVAKRTLRTIQTYGYEHEWARQAAGEMVEAYEYLVQKVAFNSVNWVTLLHRLGKLFEAMHASSFLFYSCNELLGKTTAAIHNTHRELDSRQLANVFWSFSKIGKRVLVVHNGQVAAPQLFSSLFARLTELSSVEPFEIASILGSLAVMDFHPQTCQAVLDHLTQMGSDRMDDFLPVHVSSSVRALGRLQYHPPNRFLPNAVFRTMEILESFSTVQMSNTIWGFARLRMRASIRYLLPRMEAYFVREIWNFLPQGVPLVLWSFAKMHYVPQQTVLDRTVEVLRQRMHTLTPKAMSHVAYAFAQFGTPIPKDFLQQMTIAFWSKVDSERLQIMCLFTWCLAMMFALDMDLFQRVIKTIEAADWRQELMDSDKRQLYQCMIHVQFFLPGGNDAVQKIAPELIEDCRRVWEEGQETKFVDTVSLSALPLLQRMGYAVKSRQLISKGLSISFVDVAKHANDPTLIAVQVTIPAHQFRNDKVALKGPRRWSMKLLEKEGYRVLLLDGRIWKDLASANERIDYLESLLEELRA